MENKIPTSENFLETFNENEGNEDKLYYKSYVLKFAREFAKLHVEATLKAASEKAQGNHCTDYIDKESILNSYPLENIV